MMCQTLTAQESVTMTTVVEGLNNPHGVAIQPNSMTPFVSDSGNGRIVKIVDGNIEPVITGFAVSPASPDINGDVGPLGIVFVDDTKLAIGTGGWEAGSDRVSLFELSGDDVQTADDETSGRAVDNASAEPEQDFYGLAIDQDFLFATCRSGEQGLVARLQIQKGEAARFERLGDESELKGMNLPTGITTSPDGFVVSGTRGTDQNGALLVFLDPESGDVRTKFDTTLMGIVALAYGKRSGRLYALNHDIDNPEASGLYKLVARRRNTQCEARLIQQMDRPTAMAFASDGNLYVTVTGDNGKLVRINGLDEPAED